MSDCALCVSWQVEKELKSICGDILDALDRHLLPSAVLGESKVFYNKMYVLGNRVMDFFCCLLHREKAQSTRSLF